MSAHVLVLASQTVVADGVNPSVELPSPRAITDKPSASFLRFNAALRSLSAQISTSSAYLWRYDGQAEDLCCPSLEAS